jgi:hypothetical protein
MFLIGTMLGIRSHAGVAEFEAHAKSVWQTPIYIHHVQHNIYLRVAATLLYEHIGFPLISSHVPYLHSFVMQCLTLKTEAGLPKHTILSSQWRTMSNTTR